MNIKFAWIHYCEGSEYLSINVVPYFILWLLKPGQQVKKLSLVILFWLIWQENWLYISWTLTSGTWIKYIGCYSFGLYPWKCAVVFSPVMQYFPGDYPGQGLMTACVKSHSSLRRALFFQHVSRGASFNTRARFCLLLGRSSDYAQPITAQVTEVTCSVTCPVIGRAQPEFAPSKRQKTGPEIIIMRNNLLYHLYDWRLLTCVHEIEMQNWVSYVNTCFVNFITLLLLYLTRPPTKDSIGNKNIWPNGI